MEVELLRDQVKINNVVGEDTVQAVAENDIIVPDTKPDVVKIIGISGDLYTVGTQMAQDKVVFDGTIKYKILYLSEDEEQPVKSINSSVNLSQNIFIPGARAGAKAYINHSIRYIDYSIINGRKIGIKATVDITAKVISEDELDLVTSIEGIENIQSLNNDIKIRKSLGDAEENFTIKEEFVIPEGKPGVAELLSSDLKVKGKDIKLTDNKAIVKGDLVISNLYIADNESREVQFLNNEVTFTQFVDFPGISEGKDVELFYELRDYNIQVRENSDGEAKIISVEAEINTRITGEEDTEINTVVDCFSPSFDVRLENEKKIICESVTKANAQETVKELIIIPNDAPEISEIYNISYTPDIKGYEVYDDRVVVDGIVTAEITYVTGDKNLPIYFYSQEIPFRKGVDVNGAYPGLAAEIKAETDEGAFNTVSPTEVDVKVGLNLSLAVKKEAVVDVITNASAEEIDKERLEDTPSITIYYIQPGDNLWEIAKKYNTTITDITNANSIQSPNDINIGQQIIIPKRMI